MYLWLASLSQVYDVDSVIVEVFYAAMEVLPEEGARFPRQRNATKAQLRTENSRLITPQEQTKLLSCATFRTKMSWKETLSAPQCVWCSGDMGVTWMLNTHVLNRLCFNNWTSYSASERWCEKTSPLTTASEGVLLWTWFHGSVCISWVKLQTEYILSHIGYDPTSLS